MTVTIALSFVQRGQEGTGVQPFVPVDLARVLVVEPDLHDD